MIYRDFQDKKISALGLGCMRLPMGESKYGNIDIEAVKEMVAYAIKNRVNYFDTAWGYHNGYSELVMGEVLKDYPRESFYLADKFPGYDLANMDKVEEIFEKQLEKCQVEYFDFYLFHSLNESNIDAYLDPKYGILDYLLEQKKRGRIKHLGFSTHATIENTRRFLDAYGEHLEFGMIQLNWLDYKLQNAKAKIELLGEYGLPVWVMEPLRGGKLASLAPEHEARLKDLRPNTDAVEWAFRFLQTVPTVGVTLSGMSNFEQLKENIDIYREEKPLSEKEKAVILKIADEILEKKTLPCTACNYCVTNCPAELDIPALIKIYNGYIHSGGGVIDNARVNELPEDRKPSACLGCGACEAVCPQNIKISEMMNDFASRLKK